MEQIPPNVFTAISRASARRVTATESPSRSASTRSTSTVTDAPFHQLTATDRDPSFLASEDIHSLTTRDNRCPNVSKDAASLLTNRTGPPALSPTFVSLESVGVGGGANGRHIVGGDLAAAIVDESDVDRTVRLARPSFDGRAIGPGKVGVAPLL
jgi:hypothetical protein